MAIPHIGKITQHEGDDPDNAVTIPGSSLSSATDVRWDDSSATATVRASMSGENEAEIGHTPEE
ncbi:hypothetical protein AB0I60_03350 [Actinosynnema sp. NPDC050436]|uniref:hypothetical protein n=1 Tax=Actinosynnema sp. NPDC050436 TaxID=3155659 RepID=UPI0033FE642D